MALNLGELFVRIGADMKDFNQKMDRVEQRVSGIGQKVEKSFAPLGAQFGRIGAAMTVGVSLPLAGLAVAATRASVQFESAFTGIRKTVSASEEQFAELEKGIRGMAREMPVAATELAKIGESAGQLGIEQKNILGFTKVMADLGATTNLAGDEAATSLARLANITQMNQGDFDRLGSTIVALGNSLATTEAEIVSMGLRIAGAGRQIGLSEAQILGLAGALSSVGIEAEAGGTAISRVMIAISQQVQTAGENLGTFAQVAGMSAAEFQRAFKEDAAGALVTFVEGLGKLETSGGNVFGVLEKLELQDIRVRDALLRASGAGDLFRKSLDLGSKAWEENTALTREAELRYGTTASKLQVMQNRLNDAAITLGQALQPALLSVMEILSPLIDAAGGMAERFGKLEPGTQKLVIALFGMVAALGPALLLVKGIGLAIGLLLSPVGAVAAGLVVLAGAAAFVTIKNAEMRKSAGEQADTLKDLRKRHDELTKTLKDSTTSDQEAEKAKKELSQVVSHLQKLIPGLTVEVDKETGAMKANTQQILENEQARRRIASGESSPRLEQTRNEMMNRLLEDRKDLLIGLERIQNATNLSDETKNRLLEQQKRQLDQVIIAYHDLKMARDGLRTESFAPESDPVLGGFSAVQQEAAALARQQEEFMAGDQRMRSAYIQTVATVGEAANNAAGSVDNLTGSTTRQITALDILESRLQGVQSQWSIFTVLAGEAATTTEGLRRRQANLAQQSAIVEEEMALLSAQYQASVTTSGEFSAESMDLARALDAAKLKQAELTRSSRDTAIAMAETGGAIAHVKGQLEANATATGEVQRMVNQLSFELRFAQRSLEETARAMKVLEDSTKDAERGIGDSLGVMERHLRDVESEINRVESALRGMANIRLAGEGAIEEELFKLSQQEAQIRLAINQAKREGGGEDLLKTLEGSLDKVRLAREEIELKRELEIDPLKRQLRQLAEAGSQNEMSFEKATAKILSYQSELGKLTTTQQELTVRLEAARASVGDLLPSLAAAKIGFDQAEQAIANHKATILSNQEALGGPDGLTQKYLDQKAVVDTLTGRITAYQDELARLSLEQGALTDQLAILRAAAAKAAAALDRVTAPKSAGSSKGGGGGASVPTSGAVDSSAPFDPSEGFAGPPITLTGPGLDALEDAKRLIGDGKLGEAAKLLSDAYNIPLDQAMKNVEDVMLKGPHFAKGGTVTKAGPVPICA